MTTINITYRIHWLRCDACGHINRDTEFLAGCPQCQANGRCIRHERWERVYPNGGNGNNGATTKVESAVNATA